MGAVAAGVAVAVCLACAVNPVTGKREVSLMSAEEEAAAGREGARQVASEMGLVRDPALEAYVAEIGERLARFSPRQDVDYQFQIVDMTEVNAFALPGGYVYVSRGLLALANTEDELANVIGHEIGHVAARHHAQRQTRSTGVGVASAVGAVIAGVFGGSSAASAASQLGQVAGAGLIASYGRDQERQSDEVGQRMSAEAGWAPEGMTRFLTALQAETELSHGSRPGPSFFDSHPSTPERVAATRERARALPGGASWVIARDRADFLSRLDGLVLGDDPAKGLFQDSLFLHPVLDFRLRFPTGWLTANRESSVLALSPDRNGLVKLVARGPGSDPRAVAERDVREGRLKLDGARRSTINGLRAFRGRAQVAAQGGMTMTVDLTWIALRDFVYRIDAMAADSVFPRFADAFEGTVGSFGALTPAERASIRVQRLRVVRARGGETLTALGERNRNVWSAERTAVMNGTSLAQRLTAGEPVKIAVETPL